MVARDVVYFRTKIHDLDIFWRALHIMENVGKFYVRL
jgi:hypothetical protein